MHPETTAPDPPVTLDGGEVDALRHLLDFTAGLLAGDDPDGAVMLDGASTYLHDRQRAARRVAALDLAAGTVPA